ncbi:diaminobutyrate--2-oxoglutarate transaminase [Chryseobacterium gallinarum]|uniref:diaminobutyrate--2-oxoglutarate transaminase n=1 Tax=Chryseobacterium gallinarum TaxID=1324352 RepID=UPI002023F271|nr:diaminobutyrate--2-oxoglutarate transaminase [Chryseobacterium gallinarum]MCL8537183.1 diaminobutyrate--2-oxoglutarate transaminase [Chryseobacterium gallinarum]
MNVEKQNSESNVSFYNKLFPKLFSTAKGSYIRTNEGNDYLDFFCGAGSLNYGHNNEAMKNAVIAYISNDGIINSLDMLTEAKYNFIKKFNEVILKPRKMEYKMQFTGPTGTNAVEAALKLARKYTGREKIIYFQHSFHGMTYGSMSISGIKNKKLNADYKKHVVEMPYADHPDSIDTLGNYLASCDANHLPAAVILETIQAEGGVKVAPKEWLENVAALAKKYEILLIVDEIQTGCGRTGTFFSFEIADIAPDIVCLSKSLSGYGLPLSVNLIKPEIDCWTPGEHNGTFRGNNLAFITAMTALDYWKTEEFAADIQKKSAIIDAFFKENGIELRGRGLMKAFKSENEEINNEIQNIIFYNGVLVDVCGHENNFVKIMPPLTISETDLRIGLNQVLQSIQQSRLATKKY